MGPLYDIVNTLEGEIPVLKISYSQLIISLAVLLLGILASRLAVSLLKRSLKKSNMPGLMADFLGKMIFGILIIAVIMVSLGIAGVEVGGVFIGLSAAIGLIIAFGMQDSMNNMFAGVWLATLRPIRMEEWVEVSGHTGKVSGLGVMVTELLTPDNKYITIPNREVWGSPIINYTRMPLRRVDVNVGVAYGTDLDKAIKMAKNIMRSTGLVVKEPPMDVVVTELGDSAINLQLRPWTKTDDYWALWGMLKKEIPKRFSDSGVEIPFPQMDVHLEEQQV